MIRKALLIAASAAAVAGWMVCAPSAAQAGSSTDGFIHGTITTRSGNTYTGVLRWGTEEAFWDDLFHSMKEELPYGEYAKNRDDRDYDDGERWWEVFGRRIAVTFGDGDPSRIFIARFGDIRAIEVVGRNDAEVTMKSGETIAVGGYANDVTATITVRDAAVGEIEVPWKKIDTIAFSATPVNADVPGYRLQGVVKTDSGDFDGYIQWDKQECLSIDELDGDSEDGRLSIAMGKIRSIERRSRKSSKVVLKDGREIVLDGTNDVDSSNRGILVESSLYGRVEVPWSAFDRVEFRDAGDSGRAYDDYPEPVPLRGTVQEEGGASHSGLLVFDLDESRSWEILNGASFDIEYNIPFDRIASIVRRNRSASVVTLVNGEELRLEDGQDVSDRNDGVVVLPEGDGEPTHIRWRDVGRLDLQW